MLADCLDTAPRRCYVLQPWVKWGAEKVRNRTPAQRLREAVQLSNWQNQWTVAGGECLGVRSARSSFGSGQLHRLTETLDRLGGINALVVNVPLLTRIQINNLSAELPSRVKIYDRAALVLRLVRDQVTRGTHSHAQLQLAELEYVSRRYNNERARYVLTIKRAQLITQLETCRAQRELQRRRRRDTDLPVIAVLGYTNAGKSSLVSSLVGSDVCARSERAFHTLDVLGRTAELPCGLRVLYMDTVGFLSDIPALLAPLFTATLEDVLLADLLLHVVDASHEEVSQQRDHVTMELNRVYETAEQPHTPVITVGNKLDLRRKDGIVQQAVECNQSPSWDLAVSAMHGIGIDALRLCVQKEILRVTGRTVLTLRLSAGSNELRWMYKNAVVLKQTPDPKNVQATLVNVIITKVKIDQFYSRFIKESKS